ncbi:hypothetical protein BJV82DRAFT_629745 [Fennellomyces sp. T-0311]|nr:hypothetical protein BJV82DRAFT_629745 [Fennellomyces sp. T-0311]
MTTISKLPIELTDPIAASLSSQDLFACVLVNHEWRRTFRRYYRRTVDLAQRKTFSQFLRVLEKSAAQEPHDPLGHVVLNLKVDDGMACRKDIALLHRLCPNIQYLTFRWAYSADHNRRVDGKQLAGNRRLLFSTPAPYLNEFPQLTRLALEIRRQTTVLKHVRCSTDDLKYYLQGGQNLRRLSLVGVLPQLSAEHMDAIHHCCPNLTTLYINANSSLSAVVEKTVTSSSSLEELHIRCSVRETAPETFHGWFGYFGLKYPNLRHVCLEYQRVPFWVHVLHDSDMEGYALFAKRCKRIKSIKLVNAPIPVTHLPLLFTHASSLERLTFASEEYTIGDMDVRRLSQLVDRLRNTSHLHLCIPNSITPCLGTFPNLSSLKLVRTQKLGSLETDEPLSKVALMMDDLVAHCPNLKHLTLSQFLIRTDRRAYCSLDYTREGYPLETVSLISSSISESCISFLAYRCPAIHHLRLYSCLYYDECGSGTSRFKVHMPYHRLKTMEVVCPKAVSGESLQWDRKSLFDSDHAKVVTVRSIKADQLSHQGVPKECFTVDGLNFFNNWYLTMSSDRFIGLNSLRYHIHGMDDPFMLTIEDLFGDGRRSDPWNNKLVHLTHEHAKELYRRIKRASGFPQYNQDTDGSRSSKRQRIDDDSDILMLDPLLTRSHNEALENGYMTICCESIRCLSVNGHPLVSNDVYLY